MSNERRLIARLRPYFSDGKADERLREAVKQGLLQRDEYGNYFPAKNMVAELYIPDYECAFCGVKKILFWEIDVLVKQMPVYITSELPGLFLHPSYTCPEMKFEVTVSPKPMVSCRAL